MMELIAKPFYFSSKRATMKTILSFILFAATSMALDLPDKQIQRTNSEIYSYVCLFT